MADTWAIPEDRPLTPAEQKLIQWLLEHGSAEAMVYLPQLGKARVVSRCSCGCASIDFAIDGVVPLLTAPMGILADFQWKVGNGPLFGVFVFARSGLLAGLEIWSVDGLATANALPDVALLE